VLVEGECFFLLFPASEGKTALLFRFSSLEKGESQKEEARTFECK
jgi:hypothetical protein